MVAVYLSYSHSDNSPTPAPVNAATTNTGDVICISADWVLIVWPDDAWRFQMEQPQFWQGFDSLLHLW